MWAIGSVSTDVVERVPGAFSRRGGQRGQCADGSSFDGVADEAAPLRWQDGVLLVLDQRRLPSEEAWVRCRTAEQVADCIRSMVVRGAPAIGLAAAYGMALAAQAGGDLEAAAALIRQTRPTAANLGWAVDRALQAKDPLALAERLHREQKDADRRLAELGAERFAEGDRALTHCNTGPLATGGFGTAGGVLRAAWERGRLSQVWVDETRPRLQGARLTAWELRRVGIPFRVIADSAAGGLIARGLVDRVIVGADRIAANGDIANKVGTYPLAVLAARHGIPFYVAAPLSTIDRHMASGEGIPIEERDPAEVSADRKAFNPAFDVTPAELVSAVFTEAGVLEPPYGESIARVASG
jgi:methylthioribose-1-phosphate isomerase